jgi:energy-coupling factor transport system substrate-specific component
METKNLGKKIVGVWNTKTIVAVAIGAALFGVLMNYGGVPVFTNTSLTTAMIVPVVVGSMYGALPAAVAAGVGNVIADLIGGWGLWFDWSVGNLVAGCFVGLGAYLLMSGFTAKNIIAYILLVVLGNGLAFGVVTPILTSIFYGSELNVTFLQAIWGSLSNILVEVVIGLPVLYLIYKRTAARSNLEEE